MGFGAALLGKPRLLILDEPTVGLDPLGIRELRCLLESLKQQGMTMAGGSLKATVDDIIGNAQEITFAFPIGKNPQQILAFLNVAPGFSKGVIHAIIPL